MPLSSIVSRVYLGFFALICIMLGSAWYSIQATTQMTTRIESITSESTPLMTGSSELTIAFLDINRSLSPYFAAQYVDELEPLQTNIDENIAHYQQQLHLLSQLAKGNIQLSESLNRIEAVSNQVLEKIQAVTQLQYDFLDAKDSDAYFQAKLQPLITQLNSNLVTGLSKATSEHQQTTIETLLSQITVLGSDANKAFSMQDMAELRAVKRSYFSRKERFDEAVTALQSDAQKIFSRSKQAIELFSTHVFTDEGAIAKHINAYAIYEKLIDQQTSLDALIDEELIYINELSSYADSLASDMHNQAAASSENTIIALAAISALSILIATIIGISIAHLIKRPSKQVQRSLERLADKDLTSKVAYKADNEFGYVASKVNLVLEHLSKVILKMRSSARELNQASIENQQTSEGLKASITEQTAQTTQVATAMKQIECSVNEIAQSSNETLTIVTDAVTISNNGQTMMQDNVTLLDTLSGRLEQSTETIQVLEQDVTSIESILDVISSISEQTNLLALNAAIEAARAGEQGRGFSVVADEVRVLAAKTTQSTTQIQSKIEQLQSSTSFAVSQINQCVGDMGQCVTQADSVNQNLQEMHRLLNQIEDRSTQIASATTEHQTVASEVTKHVSHIHTLAENSAKRFDILTKQGQQLEIMAEQQLELTAGFKLSSQHNQKEVF
ncbi:methyl-accepting chemotaxis protein [Vibrio sp. ZSDZ34]|uniref:Methyl-accepting chemotaxis protein n=1 Tax=Vibrio gelatinilyticus TaxID=2893468 RepID=A0A9X1WHP7_9VIBR|nr:methyl-accepting chemotaxis protein [Vibrio gelatinilyticus]MCJ2376799.1 methyl-accepting chemotaxis protein [Vibrio gelatinilyticus]